MREVAVSEVANSAMSTSTDRNPAPAADLAQEVRGQDNEWCGDHHEKTLLLVDHQVPDDPLRSVELDADGTEFQIRAQSERQRHQKQVLAAATGCRALMRRISRRTVRSDPSVCCSSPKALRKSSSGCAVGVADFKSVPAKRRDGFMQVLESIRPALNVIAQEWIAGDEPVDERLDAEDGRKSSDNPQRRVPPGLAERSHERARSLRSPRRTRSPRALAR